MPQMTRSERRKLRAETKRCREGGRPCRFCATLHDPGPHRPDFRREAMVPLWEQIAIDWQRHGWGQTPDPPEIPSWRDTVSAWQP